MKSSQPPETALAARPKRADARRNYDKLIAAAREAFAENGTYAPLEDVAKRAQVGIGTLYRHFPTRQHLLEAVYLEEVEAISQAAGELTHLPPWEALVEWLHQYLGFAAAKYALAEELTAYGDKDREVFRHCRTVLHDAGQALLERAQEASEVRRDITFMDVARMVGGISLIQTADAEQIERILDVALDGLRYKPARGSS
jgi:AcrR family transcriptional regulator